MKLTYDRDADEAYIYLDGETVRPAVDAARFTEPFYDADELPDPESDPLEGIRVDVDEAGRLVGFAIVRASRLIRPRLLSDGHPSTDRQYSRLIGRFLRRRVLRSVAPPDLSIRYDPEAYAAYIYLDNARTPSRARPGGECMLLGGSIVVDFDDGWYILGFEVLGARNLIPESLLAKATELS